MLRRTILIPLLSLPLLAGAVSAHPDTGAAPGHSRRSAPLHVQGAAAEPGPEPQADTTLAVECVQVTAIKQGLALRTRPVAATVIAGSTLDRRGLHALKELSQNIPNFHIPDYGSRMTSSVYVRGLGARIDQPAVGLNVDNIPYLSKDNYDFDLADIERIEVLRGPQSTLYGRNTMGGVINVYTLSPLNYRGTRIGAEYATGNTLRLRAATYQRPAPGTGFSAAARFSRTDGLFTNDATGRKCDWEQQGGLRLRLQLRPDTRWSIDNTLSVGLLRQGGYPYASALTGRIAYNDPSGYRRTTIDGGVTVRYAAERWEAVSITGYQYSDDRMTLDQDFLPASYFTLTQAKRDHALTEEVVIRSRNDGRYGWLAGLFGFYRHRTMEAPVLFKRTGIERLILDHANTSESLVYDIAARELPLDSDFRSPLLGAAIYHESRLTAGRWLFTAGVRLDYEHARLDYASRAAVDYTLRINGGAPVAARAVIDDTKRLDRDFAEVLPTLSATFRIDPRNNLYLCIARGYKAGGFNTQMFSDILQEKLKWQMVSGLTYDEPDIVSYDPEHSWNYELGMRFATGDGTLRGDAALFWIECRDQQLTVFPEGQTTGRMMTNAGRTRSRGGEFSLQLRPWPSLGVEFSYGFTDARFRRYVTTETDAEGRPRRVDYRGQRIPYAPRHTLSAGVEWEVETGLRWPERVRLRAGTQGAGPIVWNEEGTREQALYTLLNASLRFEHRRVSFSFWGRNLADTRYEVFYFKSIGNEFYQFGRPRTFGAAIEITL